MNRRSVLGISAATGLAAVAGCVTGALESGPEVDGEVALEPPTGEDAVGDPMYPTYGEAFPAFELPDPLTEEPIDVSAISETFLLTAFFADCPAECIPLMSNIAAVQSNVNDDGLVDETRFFGITFDPERDTADALRDHADMVRIDLEAGNYHYLRPADESEAQDVVYDTLGIPFEREELGGDDYDFAHIVVTFLVNPEGIVERAYRGENLPVDDVSADVVSVVDNW
ncbi:SCO family protein [Natrarchaeobaculum aegyptiacum]|uniref:Electron transporter SenC n=1 Tax=Natrarchaeobaculum aegyptiacum TaxID=745377 RepID=A0A2Z2I0Y5_9EURY|nr:SCO family protein [Natrarchaeobaculum aegyptiacum]ARS91324.1 electron transporter SenC [Natrarchaeobaculum aegyptiacum]